MILHDFALSSASYRVRIALNLKGLAYERRSYVLRAGEQRHPDYLALNPSGLVPTLEVDGLCLTQSLAIIDYLDRKWPTVRLIPEHPERRAKALAVAMTIACDIHPLNNLRVLQYLEHSLGAGDDDRQVWYAHWVSTGLDAIETMLGTEPGPYAGGETPDLSDICIVPQIFNARRFGVDLKPYPKLAAVAAAAEALPAFEKASPING